MNLRVLPELQTKRGRLYIIATRLIWIEGRGSSAYVGMSRDEGEHGNIPMSLFDEAPQGGSSCIPIPTRQRPHIVDSRKVIECFCSKTRPKKQELSGGIVCFSFHLFMAQRKERLFVVPQHHPFVPRNDTVTNLMRLAPTMFKFGKCIID